jgi:hypothetical protein
LLGVFLMQATEPPDIDGHWYGEGRIEISLTATAPGEYAGTYGAPESLPGRLELKWSRLQCRFNGTWREGDDRYGELSVRLVGQTIRGARSADPKAVLDPDRPRLADLVWTRAVDVRALAARGMPGNEFRKIHFDDSEVVRLSGPLATDAMLKQAVELAPNMRIVMIYGAVTDAGLESLGTLTQLNRVLLVCPKLTDAGLVHLAQLKNVRGLTLNSVGITDDGLKHVKDMPLTALWLTDTRVSDGGMQFIAEHFRDLTFLCLVNTKITDAGVKHLAALGKLQSLNLSFTAVTDAGLEPIARLTELKLLVLQNVKVGKTALLKLQRALPNCAIELDDTATNHAAPQ